MLSETAYDTALAAGEAAARSVTKSPSLDFSGQKVVDHNDETSLDTDAEDEVDNMIWKSLVHSLSRSPSPAMKETQLKSTPPADPDHDGSKDQSDVGRPSEVKDHHEPVAAHTTPQCQMTVEELSSLRKSGDSVITKQGHAVHLVKDSEGRLLFVTQIFDSTAPTSYQQPPPESSNPVRPISQKKPRKRVSMLASIDPSNIIDITDGEDEEGYRMGTPPTSSMPPSSYSLRNRRAAQGKLIYDAKYHPMDDSIRPSQAAKRRFAHGEIELSSDDENEAFSVHSESEDEDEQDTEKLIKKFGSSKSKKRSRSRSESTQPTRRSSRRASNLKVSYNMNVHPQDRYLEASSSDDEDSDASSRHAKRVKTSRSRRNDPVHTPEHQTKVTAPVIANSESENEEGEEEDDEADGKETACGKATDSRSDEGATRVQVPRISGLPPTLTSPVPDITTPPSFGIHRADELGVYLRNHGNVNSDSWPVKHGLPFDIHAERLEDQLAAEADAASPLYLDEDNNKENEGPDSRYSNTPEPLQGISVMPLSQYRSLRAESEGHFHPAARAAFYDPVARSFPTYNLGGNDGSDDPDIVTNKARSKFDGADLQITLQQRSGSKVVLEQQREKNPGVTKSASRPAENDRQVNEIRAFTPINPKS